MDYQFAPKLHCDDTSDPATTWFIRFINRQDMNRAYARQVAFEAVHRDLRNMLLEGEKTDELYWQRTCFYKLRDGVFFRLRKLSRFDISVHQGGDR